MVQCDRDTLRSVFLSLIMLSSAIVMGAGPAGGTTGDRTESTNGFTHVNENGDVFNAEDIGINLGEDASDEEDTSDGVTNELLSEDKSFYEGSEQMDEAVVSNTSETADDEAVQGFQVEQADDDVEVAVVVSPPGSSSFASDETVDVWVGAYTPTDIREPVADETLEITISQPDGGQTNSTVETDSNGSAHVEYDLTDRSDGEHEVDIKRTDGEAQTSIGFDAGPVVDIMNNRNSGIFVNEETNVSVLVRNGEFAEADEEVDIKVQDPEEGSVLEDTFTTNEEGFVEFAFTPGELGPHTIEASLPNGDGTDFERKQATEITLASDFNLRQGIFGEETVYGGYLRDADGQLGDTELTITFFTDNSDDDRENIAEENVTTNEHGFFVVPYDAPEDLDDDRIYLEAETADGTPIHVRFDRLRLDEVSEPDDADPDPDPAVTLDASVDTGGDDTAPGGEVVINIEAEENGEPIVGEEVDISFDWDGFNTPPLFATTVTTDEEGTATTTMSIPENALDNVRPSGEAVLEFDDTVATDSMNLRIREHEINTNYDDMVVGETGTFEIEVEDQLTEEPVEGVPTQFAALHTGYKIETFDTGELISGADGTDSTSIEVPTDIGPGYFSNNDVHPYRSTSVNRFRIAEHPGTLSVETAVDDEDQFRQVAVPGETVTIEFDTDSEETASGIVFADAGPPGSFGTEVTSNEAATLEIPIWVEEGDRVNLQLWGADDDPPFYEDTVFIEIEEPEGAVAGFDVITPQAGPMVDEEVVFNASDSVSTEGNLTYEWDFGDGTGTETDDPVITHTYDEPQEATVMLTVTNEADERDTTEQTFTVRGATTVTGELTHFDDQAAANDTVLAFDTESEEVVGDVVTDENGTFELLATEPFEQEAGDVRIAYYQGELPLEIADDRSELDAFPRDDRVDLFAIDVVEREDDSVNVGEIELPQGHVVEATVVDQGEPVEDAWLLHNHINEDTGADVAWGEPTNEDGQGVTGGVAGFELNGTVQIAAWEPDNAPEPGEEEGVEPDTVRELEVTGEEEVELELNATPPEAALEAPEEVEIGESFELNASASTDEVGIEVFNFTIFDEEGDVAFNQQTPGEDAVVSTNLTEGGLYTAVVETENQDGLTDEAEVEILVLDQQPNLVAAIDAEDEQRIEDGLRANLTVTNDGDVNVTEPVEVEVTATGSPFQADEVVSGNKTLKIADELVAGESITEKVTFDTITDDDERIVGDVNVELVADPDDEIDEVTTVTNTDETSIEITFSNLVAATSAPSNAVEGADARFRSFIRNTGTANSSPSNVTVSVTDDDNVAFEEEHVRIDPLEPNDRQRNAFNESFEAGEYELTVAVEDELFPEDTTETVAFEVEEYDISTVPDATNVGDVRVGLNTTVVFGFETNAQEPMDATLDTSDVDEVEFTDGSETETVTVDPETNRANLVAYDVQGLETAEDAELSFTVSDTIGVNESDELAETTNVTVQTETVTNESAVRLEEGEDETEAALEAFANNDTVGQELEVTVQAGTEGRTLQGLGYLVNYPYGCVEQTTSAFLSALNTDEYYDDRDGDVTPDQQDQINGSIEEGIERLQPDGVRGQQDDGSWNQWGREGQAGKSYFSSYALQGATSVDNNKLHGDLNSENLDTIDFNEAVEWIADDNWNQPDGYLNDEPASTGFTLVALDEAAATDRLGADTEDTLTEIYADAAVELLDSQEDVGDGVAWNNENPRSTALAVHGLQLALENEAYEEREDLTEEDLADTIDGGINWLLAAQNDDGSWDEYNPSPWFNNAGDKSETTSAALMALDETGVEANNESIDDGTDYLIDVYESDGSWGYPRATQAAIDALNELTPGAADRTVDITINVENGGEKTFEDIHVNETAQTITESLDDDELGEILNDTEESEITVTIDAETSGNGSVTVAAQVTQDVESPALRGDDE